MRILLGSLLLPLVHCYVQFNSRRYTQCQGTCNKSLFKNDNDWQKMTNYELNEKLKEYTDLVANIKCELSVRRKESSDNDDNNQKILGVELRESLNAFKLSADTLDGNCKYDDALRLYEHILLVCESKLNANHPATLGAMMDVAKTIVSNNTDGNENNRKQNLQLAYDLYNKTLSGRIEVLGIDHPDTITTMHNYGCLLKLQKKFPEAIVMYRRAIEGYDSLKTNNIK